MLSIKAGRTLIVSPETFAIVLLAEAQVPSPDHITCGCVPLDERHFLVPEALVPQLPAGAQVASGGWRRIEVSGPLAHTELLAAAASALAEVEVPVLILSRSQGLWLFVPQEKLGRALAALRQARLERFVHGAREFSAGGAGLKT